MEETNQSFLYVNHRHLANDLAGVCVVWSAVTVLEKERERAREREICTEWPQTEPEGLFT